jgi:hypothetical protein
MTGRAAVLVAVTFGCAHGGGRDLSAEAVESAYVEARAAKTGCRLGNAGCCAERATAARSATAGGDAVRAAHLWHEVAVACPERRREAALAALEPEARAPSAPGSRVFNISYRARLSPAYRLYWVATALGRRLLPMVSPPSAATGTLTVEVHAIRFADGRPGPLLVVERRFDVEVPFSPEATVTVDIAEARDRSAGPLEISARVDPVVVPRNPVPARAAGPPPPARVEKARVLQLQAARTPREFGALAERRPPRLRVCLDRDGEVDTVRLLEPVHPRFAASIVDMFRDSRHEPYRVNDVAVPSCDLLVPAFAPP